MTIIQQNLANALSKLQKALKRVEEECFMAATPGFTALQTATTNVVSAGNAAITALSNTTDDTQLAGITSQLVTLATNLTNAVNPPASS